MLAQSLALTGPLGDLASLNFLSVEHRDRTGNPQQVLQCPRSLSYLTGRAVRQEITSKIPPSGAVRKNALQRPCTYREKKLPGMGGRPPCLHAHLLAVPGTELGHRQEQECHPAGSFVLTVLTCFTRSVAKEMNEWPHRRVTGQQDTGKR